MNKHLTGTSTEAADRTPLARVAAFLFIVAALVWLAACNVALSSGNAGSPPGASSPNSSSQGGTSTANGQPQGTSPSAGEGQPQGSSPATSNNGQIRPKQLTAQDQGQGGIAISATWVVPGSPEAASVKLDGEIGFAVAMNTHSGDLGQYNLATLSVLRDDKGKEVQPLAWQSISDNPHHRQGILTFPRGLEQGSKYAELVISNVGGAKDRVLRWELPQAVGQIM